MELKDVTNLLKSYDWNLFNKKTLPPFNPHNGLYIMGFLNESGISIHDRNLRNRQNQNSHEKNLSGKVVVPENSYVVKFGKFENGFFNRMRGYSKHMHFLNSPQKSNLNVFKKTLSFAICLDLDNINSKPIVPAAMFEYFWNKKIDAFLMVNNKLLGKQNLASEYRVVRHFSESDVSNLKEFLTTVNQDITVMSTVLLSP